MSVDLAAELNRDCDSAGLDRAALDEALSAEGENFLRAVREERPHLFADAAFFVSRTQMEQMRAVIAAVERVVALPAWREMALQRLPEGMRRERAAKGAFMGYDFHLNADGAHLIEINTNAGGAFLNELLLRSQRGVALAGEPAAQEGLEQVFLEMFRNEWRLERGDAPLQCVAIVDEQPRGQYLHPEFVLAQRMFERAGIAALIADPSELETCADGLCCRGRRVDMVYNRLTDFLLQERSALADDWCEGRVVLTPHPLVYALYADKQNLALLTDAERLRAMGAEKDDVAALQAGIPQTRPVLQEDAEQWWAQRKQWFFKPVGGFGSRGTYRGDKLTQRVFDEIMRGGYIAQRMASPGERALSGEGGGLSLKSDVRCYVYGGRVQLAAARLYIGQTTNFRTSGGGFAQVRIVG